MECHHMVDLVCSKKHKTRRPCFKSSAACSACVEEDRQVERIRKRDAKLEAERDAKQAAYARQLAEYQAEIDHERRILTDHRRDEEQATTLEKLQENLVSLRAAANNAEKMRQSSVETKSSVSALSSIDKKSRNEAKVDEGDWSSAKKAWENSKRFEGAENDALDALMDMIGLDDVKDTFLSIKDKVDTAVRQNIDMKNERFGAALLGNPGTGKGAPFMFYPN
jgi:predicted ATP-dependent endonuclease of OLD family